MKGTRFLAFLLAFVLAFSSIGVADVSAAETLSGNQVTEDTLSGNEVKPEDVEVPVEEPVVEEKPVVLEEELVVEEVVVQKEAAFANAEETSVDIELRDENYSWIYEDETLDVQLNFENVPEDAEVKVYVGREIEGEFVHHPESVFDYNSETQVLTLYGEKLKTIEDVLYWGFDVVVEVTQGEELLCREARWFWFQKPYIEYDYPCSFPGNNVMLCKDDSIHIDKYMYSYGENSENPYGKEADIEITSLSVDGNDDIIGVEDQGEDGWELIANGQGYAEVTIKFYDWFHGEVEQEYSFEVCADGIKGELFLEYPNDNNMLLKGQEKVIPTSLKFRYIDDDGNYQEEWIDDYTLSFVVYEEGKKPELVQSFAGEYVSFTTDGKTINVKASDEDERYGWDNVDIKVNYTFHDKEFECDSRIDMGVTDTYFSIDTIKDVNNVEVGDTIDMDDYINVYQYKEGWDGPLDVIKKADNSLNDRKHRIRITWDKDVWEAIGEDESDPVPKLKRISPEHGTITVILQCTEPEGTEGYDANEYTDYGGFERRFEFHGLDYSVWFETDHYSVFKGEDNFFELNTENLTDKNIKSFDVQIGWFMGKEDEPVIFEKDGLYTLVYEDDETTIKGITLHGAELEKLTDSMRDGRDFDVKILVKNAYEDVPVFKQTWAFTMEDTEINYDYQYYGISMLPGWDNNIEKEFGCSIKNTQYPEGKDVRVQVIDASLELLDGTPEGVITLNPWVDENDPENYGWNIHAENYGHAQVTITYNLPVGEGTGTHSFDVWCGSDVWEMDLSTNTGSDNLLPGASLDLIATLNHKCHTERDGHFWGSIDNVEYEWNYNENVREDLVTFEQDSANPNVLHVQANANAETGQNTWIHVRAYTWDENGERYEVAYADFELWVEEGYCEIRPKNDVRDDYEIAEVFTIEPELWNVEKDREDFNISKASEVEVAFRWNYDPDALEFDEENYTFKRLKAYQTDINLEAGFMIDGEFHSRAWRRFRLQELNYDIRLQLDYNEEQERERNWLYALENYTVGIDSSCLEGKDLVELIVQVGRFIDGEHFEEFGETSGIYTLERDTEGNITGITLHGSVLEEFFGESDDRNFHVRYYVESNGEFVGDTERYQHMYLDSVEFKHLRGDGHTWVFTDEYDYTMELDMSKLSCVPGIEVEWVVGDNEFDREANCTSEEYEQYKVSDDKLSITLNGYRLKNEGDEAVEWLYSFDEVWVRAIIKSVERDSEGKVLSEKTLNVYDTHVDIRYPKYLLDGEEDSEMTFWEGDGWIYEDNVIGAYVENGTYPYGRYVELYIDDITVVNDDDEEPAFTLYTDRNRGYWNISAQRPGCASVSFNLSHARFGVQNIVKRIYSSDEVYQLQVYSDTGSHTMSPDKEMTLITELYRYTRDENGKVVETYVPTEEYKLNYFDYSTHNIEISSLTGIVTAKECGNTSVRVEAKSTTNDDVFYDGFNFDIEVSKDYTALYGEEYCAEPGSINDISKFDIRIVRKYYNENGEYVEEPYEVEDARFADTGNANYFWLAWWNQKLVVNDEINRTLPATNRVDIIAEHDGQQFEGWVNVVICEHDYQKMTMSAANGATTTYDYCAKCQHVKNYKTFSLSKTSYTFNGSVQKPSVVVLDKDGKTLDSKYYSVSYPSGCKNAGTYKVTISFKGEYSGSETLSYSIGAKKITPAVTLSKTEFTYNKKVQTPTVTVKDGATKLTANTDYTVSYSSGRKNVGKYTVTVTLKGNYSGTKTVTYTIIPKGTSISKVTAASKAFTVKWKKQATQTTGYQIQYSTSSKFSGAKTVNVKGTSTVSKAVKKLKAKKKYYVRVRTYKTVSGVTYYSSWSGAKSIKTK